jgi:uncharacterized protein
LIFVDSSFWIGFTDRADARHADCLDLMARRTRPLATSNHVVGETWTFLRKRRDHDVATRFLDLIDEADVEVVFTSREVESAAWIWLRRHDERRYSFVDAASFALMRRLHIREAFAFDGDFAAAGFVELRA